MGSSAFPFNLQHIHFPLRPSSSCLHLHRLPVTLSPSLPLFLFPWIVLKSRLYASCDQFSYPFFFIVFRIFFLLHSVQHFISHTIGPNDLLHRFLHHISKLRTCIWSTFRCVQVPAPYKIVLQMQHFISYFLIFKSNLLVKRAFFLLNATCSMAILDLISHVSCIIFYHSSNIIEIFHILQLLLIYQNL